MKILHVINAFSGGGAEKLLRDTVVNQHKQGNDVSVLVLSSSNNEFLEEVQSEGVKVYVSTCSSLYSLIQFMEVKKIISEEQYNIVHVHLFPAFYWTAIAKLFISKSTKFIYTEHSTHNRRRNKFYFRWIEYFMYSSYDEIFCISEGTKENLNKWVPITNKRSVVIPNGVNLIDYNEAKPYQKRDLFVDAKEIDKLIIMVARFSDQKDHSTLIKSLKYLDCTFKLLLVGEGARINDVKSLVHKEGLEDRVSFLGFRKDIPEIMKTCDIFVLSSNWEGFGLVAVEAMASGIPVLVSDVPGLREVVGRKDMLFPKGDSRLLAKQMKDLLIDEKRNEIVEYGINRSQQYSIFSMVTQIQQRYNRLLKV
ncbi:glycosyltransferase [Salisediminibacterium selenitireducens]|uniref:Glycosyl transferase group 1 n=1 Tax=Bacillus selenitireducens (strain ATCC 700615 / DSM 15326 / MLS10) TaxID=439292 RepID=D6Y023_BACIE|nr:glycosyltransferase [Salisediminibacterium selenitireducens]ADI00525.1 glycosyl transferase group 1 [[Bacillus] selenitireducens MLS10]